MQAYFEPEQAFSISMPQPILEISIAYKKNMYLESLQMNIGKNASITCLSISWIYLVVLFTYLFLLYSNEHKKQAFKCENSISIPKHPQILYFWIWLFGGAAYQGGEEAEAGRCTDE